MTLLVEAQNHQCKTYPYSRYLLLDSLPIEPGSITIVPELDFELDSLGRAILLNGSGFTDSVVVCFRSISPVFYQPIFNRDVDRYVSGAFGKEHIQNNLKRLPEEEIFSFGSLETYGAITRGVTFGNRQNVFVNSALNLQMEGKLSEDLKVSAVITDQNIPYQPDGNTQQIRDFDNVFIKLYNDAFEVVAGDIVLENPVSDSYFLKYYKNVQGLALKYDYKLNDRWKGRSQVSGSLAKGQFTSAVIVPQEGVQGPYRLRGANNERYIVVMANSERVYLDGVLLERGFDRDYVIDYNLGEITFSNSIVITQYSRIRADYEYSNQFYSRSNISAIQEVYSKRTQVYFNYYREKDNPSATLAFDLSEREIADLRGIGDRNGGATVSGVDSTGYMEDAVLYAKKDTVDENGLTAEIYEYSTDAEAALYTISFTEMGAGLGAYNLLNTTSNGRIYFWVGVGKGTYDPVQIIPLPNQKQMVVAGVRTQVGEYETVYMELAVSDRDQNLYSPLDDLDNSGWAWKAGVESKKRSIPGVSNYHFTGKFTYEFDQKDFTFIDRFRSVDYDRDWSYDVYADTVLSREDQILTGSFLFQKDGNNKLYYDVAIRNRKEVVNGVKQNLALSQRVGAFQLTSQNYLMGNRPGDLYSRWLKSYNQLQLMDWVLRPGYKFSIDENTTSLSEKDSVLSTVMHYRAHNLFVETGDSLKLTARFDYINRNDKTPVSGKMKGFTRANELRLKLQTSAFRNQQIGAQINYRRVDYLTDDAKNEENVLGRVSWMGSFADRHIANNMTFTTANSRELKREFVFLKVATGEGTHTWRDENGDDIQDLNEFYVAINADEKNYVKLFTPTDEYINAYQTTYVHSLDIRMPQGWKKREHILAMLSKVSFNTNLKYNFKTTATALSDRLNPFETDLKSESIISARNLIRNTIFFNRNAPGFGFDVSRSVQSSKSLLSSGFELKEKNDWVSTCRLMFGSVFTIRGKTSIGETFNSSDYLDSRNFQLARFTYMGEVLWQPTSGFRLISGAGSRFKENENGETGENSKIHEYKMEATWVRSAKGNLNASFSWLRIHFEGDENTYLGYELLEALQPGNNQKWAINWQQSLGRGLQLSLQYFGRKSSGSATIHTGTVNVTAYF